MKANKSNNKNDGENRKEIINSLDERFSGCGVKALEWRRKCELLLPEIVKYKVWKEKGFSSVYEYAAKKAGMSKRCVDEALRVLRRIKDKPELQKVAMERGIQRVRPVAVVATKKTEAFWAEKAVAMGKHTLETYVKNYREEFLPGEGCKPDGTVDEWGNSDDTNEESVNDGCVGKKNVREVKVTMKLRSDLVDRLKKQGDLNEMMEKFLDFVEGGSDEEKLGEDKPKAVKAKSRYIPVKIKRYVREKSGGKCAFPGCCKDGEILHHTQRFALEKVHDPDEMVFLCKEHERLAHLGLIEGEGGPLEEWRLKQVRDVTDSKAYIDQFVNLYR